MSWSLELELENVANVKISSSNVANFQLGIGIGIGNISTMATFTSVEVGDQIFTDVWGANRAGLMNILVKPLGRDIGLHIYLKRIIEKPIMLMVVLGNKRRIQKFMRNSESDDHVRQ